MKYRIRTGIVLTEVCGEYLLLATMDASQHCPYAYQINETAAFFWRLLEKQLDEEEILDEITAEYETGREEVRRDLRQFIEALQEQGYFSTGATER